MKYTIELTGRQRKRFKHMNKALIKMGMGFDILSLLEPVKTTNVEDTSEYKIGYTQAIADYRKFERFFNSVGGIEVFEDIRNTDGTLSIDMILQYLPMPEIMARIKAYEKKKKAEEIENYHILVDTLRTVTEEYPKETIVSALSEFGFEVDKLRGENE